MKLCFVPQTFNWPIIFYFLRYGRYKSGLNSRSTHDLICLWSIFWFCAVSLKKVSNKSTSFFTVDCDWWRAWKFHYLFHWCCNPMNRYKVTKQLGDGTYGSVLKATNRQTGEVVRRLSQRSFHILSVQFFRRRSRKWRRNFTNGKIVFNFEKWRYINALFVAVQVDLYLFLSLNRVWKS